MPKAKPYKAKDGTTSYRVRYRLDGTSTSTTFRGPPNAAKREADAFAKMIHAVGPADALAWQRRNDGQHTGSSMPLNDWAAEYIAGRTGVTDGTTPRLPTHLGLDLRRTTRTHPTRRTHPRRHRHRTQPPVRKGRQKRQGLQRQIHRQRPRPTQGHAHRSRPRRPHRRQPVYPHQVAAPHDTRPRRDAAAVP